MTRNALRIAALVLAFTASAATAATLTILPPAIPVLPGTTVGFGYQLENDSATQYFFSTALSLQIAGGMSIVDLFDYPVVSPGATEVRPYDSVAKTGLLELQIPNGTAPGSYDLEVLLLGELLSSPTAPSGTPTEVRAVFGVTVADQSAVIPEPSSALLLSAGAMAIVFLRRRL